MKLEDSIKLLEQLYDTIQPTPQQSANGIKQFKKYIAEYMLLSDKEKHEFIKSFFEDKSNLDATESFARRHPDAYYNKYIPKE